jgi:hypothetical protein
VPASNTAVGHIILENKVRKTRSAGKSLSKTASKSKPAVKHKRAAASAKVDRVRS